MLLIGIFSALGLLLLLLKAGGRKTIGHDLVADVMITLTLMVCFYGTFSGMAAAMVGGLVASVTLFFMRKTMEHEKLKITSRKAKLGKFSFNVPTLVWVELKPDWKEV